MKRLGALFFVACFAAGCGGMAAKQSSAGSGTKSVTSATSAPTATAAASAAPQPTPSAQATAEASARAQMDDEKLAQEKEVEALKQKLEEEQLRKSAAERPAAKPEAAPKAACKCLPGDPLCSCVDIDGKPAGQTPSANKPKASVRAASTGSMSGRLTTQQVESAVTNNIDRFAGCASGDVTVSLHAVITGTGRVADASAARSAPDEARIRDCVVAAFKGIQFPANADGKSVPIEFDLVLSPSS